MGFFFTQKEKDRLYTNFFSNALFKGESFSSYEEYWLSAQDAGDQMLLAVDMHTYLTDDILTKVDRMSMAHSLEVRSPFLDKDLIEFMATVPRRDKFTFFDRKRLLKQVAKSYLPSDILNRPKKGFSIPLGEWLRGPLRPFLEELLLSKAARKRDLFNRDVLRRMIDDHLLMRRDYSQQLWAMLMLESWFLENENKS